jgi:hypothetical protein
MTEDVGVIGRTLRSLIIPVLQDQLGVLPPDPTDIDRMHEWEIPYRVSIEVRETVEQAVHELNDIASRLEEASIITRSEILRQFEPRNEGT